MSRGAPALKGLLAALCALAGMGSAAMAGELILRGERMQGGLIVGEAPAGTMLHLDGKPLPVTPEGKFVFGFDRDRKEPALLEATFADGTAAREEIAVAARDYDIQHVNGVARKYVSPPPETLARIRADAVKKRKARVEDSPLDYFAGDFIWPVTGPISGVYGSQRFYNGEPRRPHYGLDIAAGEGAPVRAPQAGTVRLAEPDMYFEGGLIFIDHGHSLISVLMHLSSVDVKAGMDVKQGDVVGKVGATGRVTGPHLDWRMYWRDAHVDPQLLLGPQPEE
jgi:murein DD-endopeptidase MepM/ murein hydrolase activator NlpD